MASPNCLVGCIGTYQCGPSGNSIDGHNISPIVKVFFESPDNPTITVGNESSPNTNNHAVIKSMEYSVGGSAKGHHIKVEIVDEQGGNFVEFAERLNKCIKNTRDEYNMKVRFGWVVSNCNGTNDYIESPTITFTPVTLVIDISSGTNKFIVEGVDAVSVSFTSHNDQIFGDDVQKVPLKQAIRRLCEDISPSFNVEFLRLDSNGNYSEWDFKGYPGDGPESSWEADGQHKLAAIMKWIEPYQTDQNKGITPIWNTSAEIPTLALLEDTHPGCDEYRSCSNSLASYIVGGGNCSPVIKFTPTINWTLSAAASMAGATGTAGGATTGEAIKKEKSDCDVQSREYGVQQYVTTTRQAKETYGRNSAMRETEKSQNLHLKANLNQTSSGEGISAELQIQGNPSSWYVHTTRWVGKTLSIAVINPFHINVVRGNGDNEYEDWLARPGCNNILSNRSWQIMGVNHTIREGSYITSFSLFLAAPGANISELSPLGGNGSEGWTPSNSFCRD